MQNQTKDVAAALQPSSASSGKCRAAVVADLVKHVGTHPADPLAYPGSCFARGLSFSLDLIEYQPSGSLRDIWSNYTLAD